MHLTANIWEINQICVLTIDLLRRHFELIDQIKPCHVRTLSLISNSCVAPRVRNKQAWLEIGP